MVGAQRDVLFLLLAVAAGGEHLLRVRASLTGRPTSRAASAASVGWGQTIALHPKLPPTKWLITRTFDGGMPEQRGHGQLGGGDALGRVVEHQPVAVPDRGGRRWLDRVVVVGREW